MTKPRRDNDTSNWASAQDFERGIMATQVARKCNVLDSAADRELLWWLQFLSWQEGGLTAFASGLLAKYPDRIKNATMAELGIKPGMICNRDQVKQIRESIPGGKMSGDFPLKGETDTGFWGLMDVGTVQFEEDSVMRAAYRTANQHPDSYPAQVFLDYFRGIADERLEGELRDLCVNPQGKLTEADPWWFPTLLATLRECQAEFARAKSQGMAATEVGRQVCEGLDYTCRTRGLTLIEGETGRGKSFAAENWCARHPGRARIIEVPPGNDDASFYRGLARGLGLGNFQNKRIADVREDIESVLLTGHLVVVLDEGQRLWPMGNIRYTYPKRVVWLMSLANKAIPFVIIATNQFLESMTAAAEFHQWNTAQLGGRITWTVSLPSKPAMADLLAVAQSVFPGVDDDTLTKLAAYTSVSDFCLRVIKNVRERAFDNARQAGRPQPSTSDVRKAMKALIPVYSRLVQTLAPVTGKAARAATFAPAQPAALDDDLAPDLAGSRAASMPAPARGGLETTLPAPRRGNIEAPESIRIADLNEPLLAG